MYVVGTEFRIGTRWFVRKTFSRALTGDPYLVIYEKFKLNIEGESYEKIIEPQITGQNLIDYRDKCGLAISVVS